MRISDAAREMLTRSILPFWESLKDTEFGGFYGYMGYDLKLDTKAEKGCILNSRILWFFSEAALLLNDETAKACAEHAWNFMKAHCVDHEHEGMFWSVTYDGKPLDTTKHTYNQAFAIYALASYFKLTGSEEALSLAYRLFHIIENRCKDGGGYLESFDRAWQPEDNDKLSENGVMAERTMNTLLHVIEAYSGLYAAHKDQEVGAALKNAFVIYTDKIYSAENRRLEVFFDKDYHTLIDLHSYGHDIEASWLAEYGANLLENENMDRCMRAISASLAEHIYEKAFKQGSVMNECEKGIDNTTRVWWIQAESVLGFVNAFIRTGDTKYADAAKQVWEYINTTMVDKRPGSEWFWSVNEDGTPIEKPIVEPWKCPYHNGRMCMELMRRDPDVYV